MADSAVRRLLWIALCEMDALSDAIRTDKNCPKYQAQIRDHRDGTGDYAPRVENGVHVRGSGGGGFPAGETAKLLSAMHGRTSPPPNRDFQAAYKDALAEVMDRPAATVILPKIEALKAARTKLLAQASKCYHDGRGPEGLSCSSEFYEAFSLVDAYLQGIEKQAVPKAQQEAAPEIPPKPTKWPPKVGWAFRHGEYAYNGRVGRATGKLWKLLKMLADRDGPVSRNEMLDEIWPERAIVAEVTIPKAIERLRARLRVTLGLTKEQDPIPSCDHTDNSSWQLDPAPALSKKSKVAKMSKRRPVKRQR